MYMPFKCLHNLRPWTNYYQTNNKNYGRVPGKKNCYADAVLCRYGMHACPRR